MGSTAVDMLIIAVGIIAAVLVLYFDPVIQAKVRQLRPHSQSGMLSQQDPGVENDIDPMEPVPSREPPRTLRPRAKNSRQRTAKSKR